MTVTYFQRYRMQYDIDEGVFPPTKIPEGYRLEQWDSRLIRQHAQAKHESFRNEIDANVFPCLRDADGCLKLMREISQRKNFVPESTWLLRYEDPRTGRPINCGTVQGIRTQAQVGAIQNIGVTTAHRGKGLGAILMQHCLSGFEDAGVDRVTLEVTCYNTSAIRLYERLGFRIIKTVFKSVEISYHR